MNKNIFKRNVKPIITYYGDESVSQVINEHLIGFSTSKLIDNPIGNFTIQILPSSALEQKASNKIVPFLLQKIFPMDLISFQLTSEEPYFLGVVDSISITENYNADGFCQRGITISGRDGGKLLQNGSIAIQDYSMNAIVEKYDILNAKMQELTGIESLGWSTEDIELQTNFYKNMNIWTAEVLGKTPFEAITNLFKLLGIFKHPVRWSVNNNKYKTWESLFHISTKYIKGYFWEGLAKARSVHANNLIDALKNVQDATFQEFWIDTLVVDEKDESGNVIDRNLKWVVRFRPKPFDRSDDKLPLFNLTGKDKLATTDNTQLIAIDEWTEKYKDFNDFIRQKENSQWTTYLDATWDKTTNIITEDDYYIINMFDSHSIGYSDSNIYSIYRANTQLAFGNQIINYPPVIDILKFVKYGTKELSIPITINTWDNDNVKLWEIPLDNTESVQLNKNLPNVQEITPEQQKVRDFYDIAISSLYLTRFYNWNAFNDILLDGTITMPADDRIRVGDKIKIPNTMTKFGIIDIIGYVVGVENRYTVGDAPKTTIRYIRGINEEVRLSNAVQLPLDFVREQLNERIADIMNPTINKSAINTNTNNEVVYV